MPTPLSLVPHPASPLVPVLLTVEPRLESRELVLHYRLRGEPGVLRLPASAAPGRADRLWQHTCVEAFVAREGEAAYHEFNLSPAGQWAHYAFRAERTGMHDAPGPAPLIERRELPDGLDLIAVIDRHALPAGPWVLGLSAVLEDHAGRLAHLALQHPREVPDFHHRGGWTLRLDP